MPRSVVDATRFTATSPHAYSKPSPIRPSSYASTSTRYASPSQQAPFPGSNPSPTPPTPRETPQEKVARLRAQRVAARDAQLSVWDRTVLRGRAIADRAHKITAISLIGLTVVCGGITAFALTDMILHNRRKRTAFYNEQHLLYTQRLLAAIETEKAGLPLTDDQTLVLNRERAKVWAEERKKEQKWSRKVKNVMYGGLKKDMDGQGQAQEAYQAQGSLFEGGKVPTEGEILEQIGIDRVALLETAEGKRSRDDGSLETGPEDEGLLEKVQRKRRGGERELEAKGARGGMLDQLAENVSHGVRDKGGWFGRGNGA